MCPLIEQTGIEGKSSPSWNQGDILLKKVNAPVGWEKEIFFFRGDGTNCTHNFGSENEFTGKYLVFCLFCILF